MFLISFLLSAFADIVVLPQVEFASPVDYPEQALQQGIGANILLQISIDVNGAVVEAEVIESSDPTFDASALQAIANYKFVPAMDEQNQPVFSTIQYRLVFDPQQLPQVVAKGRVLEAGIRQPLEKVEIRAISLEDTVVSVQTDVDGYFRLTGLQDGEWVLEIRKGGLETVQQTINIQSGEIVELEFRLVRDQAKTALVANDSIVVEADRETSEVSVKTITAQEIYFLPGSNGDVVKAVQNLPGVARAASGIGQLIIRGTAPEDSAFYIDGSPIPEVFHFAGLTTVLSTANIEKVQYLPGNYSVRYGRQLGGLVDIQTPSVFPERDSGFVSVDLYQSALFVQHRFKENLAVSVSGRRSYADVILNPIFQATGANFRTPRYYDFQTQMTWKTNTGGLVQGIFFLSDDKFAFSSADKTDDGEEKVNASFSTAFQKFQFKYNQPLQEQRSSILTIGTGPQRRDFQFDLNGTAYEKLTVLNLREEIVQDLRDGSPHAWKIGLDINSGVFDYVYDLPSFPYPKEEAALTYVNPAGYGEYRYRGEIADIITGIRVDQYYLEDANTQTAIDPRILTRWTIVPDLRFVLSSGLTNQAPLQRERSTQNGGDPNMAPERSLQNSFGFQQDLLGGALQWQAIGYYNYLYDLVVGREDRFQFFTGPPPVGPFDTEDYANDGTGMVCGTELQVRYADAVRIGQFSGSFSHSERTDRYGETRLFAYDQPIVLNALYSQLLPKNWRLGGRIRFGSGNPYTPVVNRVYDLNRRQFIPIYGERDSDRLPNFFAFDIRIDKEYVFRNWKLVTYLDVQNATANKNIEIMGWSYDYAKETPIQGNPTFPVFGLKGEW